MTRVGVVVPVYNGAPHLGAAIETALAQTAPPAEIIVVDDGSEDGTADVAAGFGRRIRYLRQQHAGAAQARNAGARSVQSECLAFLDSDDLWAPDKLQKQMALLEPGTMVFGHAAQFASPELSPDEVRRLRFDASPAPALTSSAMLLHTADFHDVGPFDPTLRAGEFIEWYARAQAHGLRALTPPDTVLRRRLHRDNGGRVRKEARSDYARALKAVLDLRRRGP